MSSAESFTPPHGTRDAGATLVELLITMLVVGGLAAVSLSMVAVFLRNDSAASERIGESHDLQQIYVYLPGDVSSALLTELIRDTETGDAYLDANDPDTVVPCSGYAPAGVNVLNLKWNERFGGSATQYRVNYRIEAAGGETRLVRVSCQGVTLGPATVQVVARHLDPAVPVDVDLNGAVVVMTVKVKTGQTLTITATSKNPNDSLQSASDFDD